MSRDRQRNLKKIKPKRVILIATEGINNVTEKKYFKSFVDRNAKFKLEFVPGNETDPVGLVKQTLKTLDRKGINLKYGDQAYCVFDGDMNRDKNEQITKAITLAKKRKINLIISNPSVEIWFLLHYNERTAKISGNQIIGELQKYCPQYNKNYNIYEKLCDNTEIAITRAKKLEEYHIENNNNLFKIETNPYTNVYKLVEELLCLNE